MSNEDLLYGFKLIEKKRLFVILGGDLARSPDTLRKMGGRSSNNKRWTFLNEKRSEVEEWLAALEKGDVLHDFEEPVVPRSFIKSQNRLKPVEITTGPLVQPQIGDSVLITVDGNHKKVRFMRTVSKTTTSTSELVYEAIWEEKNVFLTEFAPNRVYLRGEQWVLDGFSKPHRVRFYRPSSTPTEEE